MEVHHKSKPWHGAREFLKEWGIIVLGVLTALSFEQAVEALHWRHEVETERAALNEEVAENLGVIQDRLLEQPCIDRRLTELDLVFQRHDRGQPLGIAGRVGVPLSPGNSKGSWTMAVSGGGLNHMPHPERLEYSGAFGNYEAWDRIIHAEHDAWLPLGVLDHSTALRETDWAMLRVAFVQARAASDRAAHVGPYMLRRSAMGQKPKDVIAPAEVFKSLGFGGEICQPLLSR
jgi:hypothetical protein